MHWPQYKVLLNGVRNFQRPKKHEVDWITITQKQNSGQKDVNRGSGNLNR